MTISLSTNVARQSYAVSQGATQSAFTVSFAFFDDDDLNVFVDGTLKTLTTHYTVSGGDGSAGSVTMTSGNEVTGISGGSTVVITRDIDLDRTTDFPSSGPFAVATLNTELDKITAQFADRKDVIDRSVRLQDQDEAQSMELPLKADRLGKVLGFNATTGAVEAGPTIADTQSLAAISADIASLADIEDGTTATDAISGLAAIASNVTTVAGIASNVTSVAGAVTNINLLAASDVRADMALLGTSDVVADMALLANSDVIADMNTLATSDIISDLNTLATSDIVSDLNTLATADIVSDINLLATSDIVSDLNTLATSDIVSDINTLATSDIVSDLNTLATSDFVSDLNAVEAIASNVTTVANNSSNINTVASNISTISAKASLSGATFTGVIDVTDTTDASDASGDTGAIRTEGGVSIAKKLFVGTDLDVDGTANLDVVDIDGAVDMASTLTVAGNVTSSGTVSGAHAFSHRNVLINGSMACSQRGTSSTGQGASDLFLVDRFHLNTNGNSAGRFTVSQASDGPSGIPNSLKLACTTADTSIAAGERFFIEQRLEGQDCQRFAKGTSDAQQITVSFYVKANAAATYVVGIYDSDNSRQIGAQFSVTTSWNRVSVTFPADTGGSALGDDNAESLSLRFYLHAGSTYTGGTLQTTWDTAVNNEQVGSGTTSFFDSTDRTFFLTGVQMELGDVATPFEHLSFQENLKRCQRYYYQLAKSGGGIENIIAGATSGGTNFSAYMPLVMRAAPSITFPTSAAVRQGSGTYNVSSWQSFFHPDSTFTLNATMSSSATANTASFAYGFNADIDFDAEL